MGRHSYIIHRVFVSLLIAVAYKYAIGQTRNVNVTTWHADIPAICTGCTYRTGQNLQESTIKYT